MESQEKRGSLNKEQRPELDSMDKPLMQEEEENLRGSVFEADTTVTSFWGRIKILMSNSCFLYLTAAGALRFFGGYSLGFLSGPFFEERYPDYTQ